MFFHHKDLAYTVRVDKPNLVFARMLQQAIGGPEGELRVVTQSLFAGVQLPWPRQVPRLAHRDEHRGDGPRRGARRRRRAKIS